MKIHQPESINVQSSLRKFSQGFSVLCREVLSIDRSLLHACLVSVSLAVLTFAVFGQTARHDFSNIDDFDYVYGNPQISGGLTFHGFQWAFTHCYAANWHPLTWISLMLDCQSGKLDPGVFHTTNVKLHAITGVLIFVFLWQATDALWESALVAFVFLLHPLRVESVAWIAERKDVLSGLFFALTLCSYLRYVDTLKKGWYVIVMLCMILGLLSKSSLVTLPFLMLLLDYWPLRRFGSQPRLYGKQLKHLTSKFLLLEKLPFVILSIGCCVITIVAQEPAMASVSNLGLALRASNALISYTTYLGQIFYPVGLTLFYPYPSNGISAWKVVSAFSILATISVIAFYSRKNYPYVIVGWFWYLGMLIPMIGLVQVGLQARADRYTYLPEIGTYVTFVWAGSAIYQKLVWKKIFITVELFLAAAIVIVSFQQTSRWKDADTFWTHSVSVNPLSSVAQVFSGQVLFRHGQVDDAISHYNRALLLDPFDATAHEFLAQALVETGQFTEAIDHYNAALAANPNSIGIRNEMAWLFATSRDASVRDGARALSLMRGMIEGAEKKPNLLRTLAAAYAEEREFSEATRTAEDAMQLCIVSKDTELNELLQNDIKSYAEKRPIRQ